MIIIIILQEVIVGINILKNNIKDHSKPDIFNEKNFVFIISAGRTGTKFLGDKLSEIIENSYSVHEPDVLNDDFKNIINKIYQFGIYQMIIGKFLNKTGIRNLSQNYISRKININQLVTQLINHREKFYKKINSNLIIESYSGWYGVIPGIQKLYKYYKIIIIIRDPREWIRSTINWQNIYGKKDFVQKLSFLKLERLNPEMTQDMNYSMDWKEYSKFEKLCWMYNSLYSIMLSEAKNDQNIEVVRYEDIFNPNGVAFKNMLIFISEYPNKIYNINNKNIITDKKIHQTKNSHFPQWHSWDDYLAKTLNKHCHELMTKYGYGEESEWIEKINR